MNQTQLASKLGVSRMQVSKWKGKGMPVVDLGKAKVWLAKNVASRQRELKLAGKMKPLRKAFKAEKVSDNLWIERLTSARMAARHVNGLLQQAITDGEVAQIRPLLSGNTDAVEALAKIERLAAEAEIQSGHLVHRDTVRDLVERHLKPLREALDKLPLNERTACNPQRPEIAEKALSEWRDRLILQANEAASKF